MHQFARYLFRENKHSTIYITAALVGAVWMTQSLRYIDFVMARGLSIVSFFKLVIFTLPNLIAIVLPFSFFVSLLFVLNKFYNDRELIVFQSVGLSNTDLYKPVFKLSCIIVGLIYFLNFYFYPLSNQFYRASKNNMINSITTSILSPGEFTLFKKMTFFTREKVNPHYVKGLLVYDQRVPNHPVTIIAEGAKIVDIDNGLRFILINGNRQETDRNNQMHLVSFDLYALDLINDVTAHEKDKKPNEYFITQLFQSDALLNPSLQKKLRFEGHQRIAVPLVVFPFSLLAFYVFLTCAFNRRGRYARIVLALGGGLFIQIAIIALLNLSRQFDFLLPMTYGFTVLTCLLFGGQLFYKEWKLPKLDYQKK